MYCMNILESTRHIQICKQKKSLAKYKYSAQKLQWGKMLIKAKMFVNEMRFNRDLASISYEL